MFHHHNDRQEEKYKNKINHATSVEYNGGQRWNDSEVGRKQTTKQQHDITQQKQWSTLMSKTSNQKTGKKI